MFAQWAPGRPSRYKSNPEYTKDTYDNREKWFKECLDKIKDLNIKEKHFLRKLAVAWLEDVG